MAYTAQQNADGITVVTIHGQLIVGNRQELKQLIDDALQRGDRKFLMDFTPTAYVDSSGLGALVSINKKIREANGTLRLAGLNEDLASLFELTKLDTLFNITETLPEALAAF